MKHWQIIGYWLVATGWLLGCGEKKAPPLFERLYNTGIQFTNTVSNSKDMNIFTYRNFYNGGGVGIGDLNNDSLPDVFMTGNMGPNKLFFNKGNFVFEEVSAKAGIRWQGEWSTGVVMVDINGDGWLDLYVCNAGQEKIRQGQANRLYINNRNGTFTDSAQAYGLAETGYTTHASFFDYDLDGDLDCYILNNSFIPVNTLNYANKRDLKAQDWPVADFLKGGGDKLLRNDSGHFTDVTEKAGIYSSLIGFGLGITTGDINGDGYPDLYVSNDFFERDYLYINNRDGTFREELENRVQHLSLASMGADIADVNNDGFPDIFTTDMLPDDEVRLKTTASFDNIDDYNRKVELGFYRQFMQNTLQVNDRSGNFLETAYYSGVAGSDWSWGGLIFDADNDGLSDLYVCNGIYHDVTDQDFINFLADEVNQRMAMTGKKEEVDSIINKMPTKPILNKAFKNRGNLSFSDEGLNWGFTEPSFSNGAAYADLDNDGDLDMVINNVNQPAFVYRNNSRQQNPYHYISLLLQGQGANTFAIGSHIKVYQGGQIISREVIPSRGFQSSVDYRQVIGLGNGQPDSVVVTWPNRSVSVLVRPAVDQLHILQQPNDTPSTRWGIARADSALPLLQPVPSSFDKHNEDGYNDFYYERNIPVMLSREGPRAAMGDVNGDGLTDVYICGAAYQAGQLYLQTPTGGFVKKEQPAFALFANFEDAAAIFFDCDNDRDLDLLVGSGGDSAQANSREIQNRLYRNDGQGNFTLDASALPPNADNCGALAAHDFDGDGDWDLFVGSRCVTNSYGVSPASYLLVNDGKGRFTDATPPTLSKIGMVTSAVWANVVGDAQLELIVVGEWMAPQVWGYNGNTLEPVRNNLGAYSGWWQCVTAADMDGDGDQDLVMGNMGLNFYLRPRADAPVKLFLNDFDGNGSLEKIMTRSIQGRDMPVFMKREMVEQIPSLKKQNLQNKDYAGKAIQDLFAKPLIEKSQLKECRYAASCVAYNQGNGQFAVQDLPPYAQLSCVNAVLCTRLNNDALPDLLIGGNNFNFQPQFGRLDANFGQVLLNSQNGFTWPGNAVGSLHLTGQIKYLGELLVGGQRHFLVLQNNQVPLLYKLRTAVR